MFSWLFPCLQMQLKLRVNGCFVKCNFRQSKSWCTYDDALHKCFMARWVLMFDVWWWSCLQFLASRESRFRLCIAVVLFFEKLPVQSIYDFISGTLGHQSIATSEYFQYPTLFVWYRLAASCGLSRVAFTQNLSVMGDCDIEDSDFERALDEEFNEWIDNEDTVRAEPSDAFVACTYEQVLWRCILA